MKDSLAWMAASSFAAGGCLVIVIVSMITGMEFPWMEALAAIWNAVIAVALGRHIATYDGWASVEAKQNETIPSLGATGKQNNGL